MTANDQPQETMLDDHTRINSPTAGAYNAGQHSRDAEVAQANSYYEASAEEARVAVSKMNSLQEVAFTQMVAENWHEIADVADAKAAELQEQLVLANEARDQLQQGVHVLTIQRDAALEQVWALVKAANSALEDGCNMKHLELEIVLFDAIEAPDAK